MFRQPVVIATKTEDQVAGLPDVDAVSDVLEEEGEALSTGQRCHVILGEGQVPAGRRKGSREGYAVIQRKGTWLHWGRPPNALGAKLVNQQWRI